MARLGHIFLTLLLTVGLAFLFSVAWIVHTARAPGPLTAEKLVYITPGSSVRGITTKLINEGAVRRDDELVFLISARLQNRREDLKAGEYQLLAGMNIDDIISLLQSGRTYQHKITIPEGLMVVEIIGLLKNEPVLSGDIAALPPEGVLLPETYKFSRGDTRQSLIERMKKSMQDELQTLWAKRAEGLPLKTPEEAVILASVVEKETGLAAERPRVAGVFVNRLNRGIPLQSDPTVIYAVTKGKEKLDRALTYKDLKIPSPYNTYVTPGLPPAPIANPGRASLSAVLNPEKNDYIYFVADGSGGHAFAKTLAEHDNNVARWRELQKNAK